MFCTNHHLKRKKWRLWEIRVGLIEPEVRSSFSGSHQSCSSACWVVDVVQHVGGEILNEFANGVFERSSPHLFLYLLLFKRKTIQTRSLPVLNYWGVKFYWGKVHEMFKWLSFFLLLFSLYVHFLFSFYYGKLGIIGNFAEWRNERGCTRYVEYLPDGTYQALNKDARV